MHTGVSVLSLTQLEFHLSLRGLQALSAGAKRLCLRNSQKRCKKVLGFNGRLCYFSGFDCTRIPP